MYPVSLNNFGYFRTKIPSQLYKDLLKECLQAEYKNPSMVSGLTAKGVTPHYFVTGKTNLDNLTIFVHQMREAYDKEFPGLGNTGVLSRDRPYCLDQAWINIQRKGQFVPAHVHDGIYSYTIWMKIPYEAKKENPSRRPVVSSRWVEKDIKRRETISNVKIPYSPSAGTFEFSYANTFGAGMLHKIVLDKKDEGDMLLFPSRLQHLVYPFYTSSCVRLSISGNILYDVGQEA